MNLLQIDNNNKIKYNNHGKINIKNNSEGDEKRNRQKHFRTVPRIFTHNNY